MEKFLWICTGTDLSQLSLFYICVITSKSLNLGQHKIAVVVN